MHIRSLLSNYGEKMTHGNRRSWGHFLMKLPLLGLLGGVLVLELCAYFWLRVTVACVEYVFARRARRGKKLHQQRREVTTYPEYIDICKSIDQQENRIHWKFIDENKHYNSELVTKSLASMRKARHDGDARAVMDSLWLSKNFGGILNLELYTKMWSGTKHLIEEYIKEAAKCIDWLSNNKNLSPDLQQARKEFFHSAKAEFGATTLFLSGGAMMGLYHLGVVKGLLKQEILPNIICGTSAGAVIGCYLSARTDTELIKELDDTTELHQRFGPRGPFWGGKIFQAKQAYFHGSMYESENFSEKITWFTKNLTFKEAHERTGRVLNITCTPMKTKVKGHPPLMLNYITSPHVPLSYAVMASSCVPFLMLPVSLVERIVDPETGKYIKNEDGTYKTRLFLEKSIEAAEEAGDVCRMRDGTFESDIPIHYMAHAFNSQYNVVSQVNPHMIPFFFNNTGEAGKPLRSWHNKGGWRGGFFLSLIELWLKEDMKKNLRVLAGLNLLFDTFGVDWSSLWLQESMGDVTLTPPLYLPDYWMITNNLPDGKIGKEMLDYRINVAERTAWKAVPLVTNRMVIQKVLDAAEQKFDSKSEQANSLPGSA